jgi:uncharacterized small protein (DUF1192 family)
MIFPAAHAARVLLTSHGVRSTLSAMDLDDALPRPDDLLAQLARQDLDPFSVAELEARITALEGEIARSRIKMERAVNHRASADQLFRS